MTDQSLPPENSPNSGGRHNRKKSTPADPAPQNSDPLNCSFNPGRQPDRFVVRAPDAGAYTELLKQAVNAGLHIHASNSTTRTIDIRGSIPQNCLDSFVNQLGCTVTPMFTQQPPPRLTTMALGEEGQGWPGLVTTQAIPETGVGRPQPDPEPDATTAAVGEEGQKHPNPGRMRTQAIPETGMGRP